MAAVWHTGLLKFQTNFWQETGLGGPYFIKIGQTVADLT